MSAGNAALMIVAAVRAMTIFAATPDRGPVSATARVDHNSAGSAAAPAGQMPNSSGAKDTGGAGRATAARSPRRHVGCFYFHDHLGQRRA
ncbi:MAG: hypothetical protein LJE69_07875 [Thiohalocapsa sp.]|jgi:hypothetical protein|uniref:hypothetical protein n=1 Tax=Thiohalocapsa sp. TaxID=2497641 RepID=UPI0025D47386|nr:hypothetical protein [Thiohalocapsa sp.]MCG6941153.1 hypothetical protein [Thiohalocapsa sp.]